MSKAEIIAELPTLSPADLAEIQAKLSELRADPWEDDELTEEDKRELDARLAELEMSPNEGLSWKEVEAMINERLRK